MKQTYHIPEMEVIYFEAEDIIATSVTPVTTIGGLINGGVGGDVGSGDSGKFEDLFPGLRP